MIFIRSLSFILILPAIIASAANAQVKNLANSRKNQILAQENKVARVSATYTISFTGIELGKYHFSSILSGQHYALSGKTKLQLFGNWMKWTADVKSSGFRDGRSLKPHKFGYVFKGRKNRTMSVVFPQTSEQKISITPKIKKSSKRVTLKPEHFENVFDPMTGLVSLTRYNARNAEPGFCNRRVPIFDGKQRYDIKLTYKSKKIIDVGQRGKRTAVVCTVQYIPIAGHKTHKKMHKFYKDRKLDVFFVPFSNAQMYVPVRIEVPTPLGNAEINATKFIFEDTGKKKIAFIK
ncbi:MAG: DUF3108 domain-containing protein [Pseudomonadota bacterium]